MITKTFLVNPSRSKNRKVVLIRAGYSAGRLPHALLSLAANLDDEVLIIDDATSNLVLKHKEEIENAICVGITTITGPYIKYSLEVARSVRSINFHVPLIWGGWHPSLKPLQTLQNKYVDKVVVGQGEHVFKEKIIKTIKEGRRIEELEDIITHEYISKDKFPIYKFNLVKNMEKYIIPYVSPRTISLYTSQGCPYGCKFCAVNSVYGKKYSAWPIEEVIDLIVFCIKKYAINGVHFDDDNFIINKKRTFEFVQHLLNKNIKINWSCDARVDALSSLSAEEWETLDRSGCKRILVGAESGAQQTLDKLNKRITPEMILEVAHKCYDHNIIPCFSMMVGVPGESPQDTDQTFELIDTLKNTIPTSELLLFLYTPYPGTPLYDLSVKLGFQEPQLLEDWGELYLDVPSVPWVDKELQERVITYNKSLPTNRDITLKYQNNFQINPRVYISKTKYLVSRFYKKPNKREALLNYVKNRTLKK